MKKIIFLTSSPINGGNGDTLIESAMESAKAQGADVRRIDIRNRKIGFCKACYKCATDGVCVQRDDMAEILAAIHESDGIVAEAPVYYNCLSAQAMTVIDRLCCTFACKTYQIGAKKKVGILLTCVGSKPDELKQQVAGILTLPSLSRAITEFQSQVFTGCTTSDTCKNTSDYLKCARRIGTWAAQ